MKLEFLSGGSPDCPLIRIFEFSVEQLSELLGEIRSLAHGESTSFNLDSIAGAESIENLSLSFLAADQDEGLVGQAPTFELRLRPLRWSEVEGLARALLGSSGGYQWLSDEGVASVLLSSTGEG